MPLRPDLVCGLLLICMTVCSAGCGEAVSPPLASAAPPAVGTQPAAAVSPADSAGNVPPPKREAKPPVRLEISTSGTVEGAEEADSAERIDSVMAALKPLQILLGRWNGTSRRAILDQPEWVWDLTTDPAQPALVMKSAKGAYIREGRLTFLTDKQEFEFATVDGDGAKRVYRGVFTKPVEDVLGDDNKPQRTYRLELRERADAAATEQWQLAFGQQENNRYIMEVERKRANGKFQRVDTVNTQRQGTSFAVSDNDYGEKTCLISQGLGTIPVSFEGKGYWVCCTGCKAAFDENPAKWVAKWEQTQRKMQPAN